MTTLGLQRHTVRVVPYDAQWSREFDEVADAIRTACGPGVLFIEHVGSTAIPGIAAKPILDVLVAVPDFSASLDLVPALASIGFLYRPKDDIPDRHFLRRGVGDIVTHHLSLAEPDSHYMRVTVPFRDALRADPALAAAYERLKVDLAARYPDDRLQYIDGKTAFVESIIRGQA